MFTRPLVITDIGKTILFRAMQGEPFEFTCFRVGDGTLTGTETPETATAMKHVITDVGTDPTAQTGDIEISEYDVEEGENGKYFQLTGKFNNMALQSQFEWTELGLFIRSTAQNSQEQLYAYGYDKFDGKDYMSNEKIDKYYEQAAKEDMYIIVDENGPSFGSFDIVEYYVENGINNVMVNDVPINEFYENEMKKRIEKSDSIGR